MNNLSLDTSREMNQRPQGDDGSAAFSPSYHREMLMDTQRVRAFQKAIEYYQNPSLDFMEMGIGTGVLSAYASKYYRHVYAVEKDPVIYRQAERNLKQLGLLDKNVTLIHADALTSELPKVDYIMAELMSTLMIHEPQVPALNRAKREFINLGGKLIPSRVVNTVTPAWSNFTKFGVTFCSPYTLFTGVTTPEIIAETRAFFTADFNQGVVQDEVSAEIETTILVDSEINSLIMNSIVQLAPNITFSGSDSLNPPMVVPIEPVMVKAGDICRITITYQHFTDWSSLHASIQIV